MPKPNIATTLRAKIKELELENTRLHAVLATLAPVEILAQNLLLGHRVEISEEGNTIKVYEEKTIH